MNIKNSLIAASVAAAITLAVAAPQRVEAGTVAGFGGSTEITQILNNVQLVMGYQKQVEGVLNEVRQYQTMLQTMKGMDGDKLKGILKTKAGEIAGAEVLRQIKEAEEVNSRLTNINSNMDTVLREGQVAADVMGKLRAAGYEVKSGDYIAGMKALAKMRQGAYQDRIQRYESALDDSAKDIERVEAIAANSAGITTHVQGFQALSQSNAIMVSQLAGMRQLYASAGADASRVAQIAEAQNDDRERKKVVGEQWIDGMFGGRSK